MTTDELIEEIRGEDAGQRTRAWQAAAAMGTPAIPALAALAQTGGLEEARAATRGLWAIVRHAGRPGAETERAATVDALFPLTEASLPSQLRRDAIWMLSELADEDSVAGIAALLEDAEVREDARMALERIPGPAAIAALEAALASAGAEFEGSLAQGLRARGVAVDGVPCVKLRPRSAEGEH